ncbi:hypothetical protein N9A96_00690 [bacterium]|nr:hypothetical protein [bacterium]MDA7910082.1 hypothetical protein [bacterium]MDB4381165.1 hypothetical protein [Mariniblastus sp.]
MSDLRLDPINQQWVAIARNRRDRPMEFVPIEQLRQQMICPFCKGNEEETPSALTAYRSDGSMLLSDEELSNWSTRVIPNRYPSFSFRSTEGRDQPESGSQSCGPFEFNHCQGIQELIIPSPRHVSSLSELTDEELKLSFRVCRDRLEHAKSLEYIQHAMLFMNCRLAAGASLGHIHYQLLGTPVLSESLISRTTRAQAYRTKNGRSMLADLADWEIAQEARIVDLTENFCVVCPFASRFAFQVWILPRSENFDFTSCDEEVRNELALHCRNIVTRYEVTLDTPAYNLLFHTEPFESSNGQIGYFELFPRLTLAAGFELGTDIWVNPVAPEAAARRLRPSD